MLLRAHDPALRGFFMNQPWTASGWGAIVNVPGALKMTSTSPTEATALLNYDPDGNGRAGRLHFMTGSWSPSGWQPIADNISDADAIADASGRRVVAAISDPDGNGAGVMYAMGWPWTASGWQAFTGPDVSEVELTAPASGGTTGLVRGSDPNNTGVGRLYFQHDPWTGYGWKPLADNIGGFAVTSPLWGGSIVAGIVDPDKDGIGDLWYQGTPWTADGWKILANNVRDVSLGRDGNGQPRITMTSQDGTVYAQGYTGAPSRYPFTAEGFMRIAANDMKLKSVRISGDVISGIRTAAGGNTIAVFQKDPLNETGWQDLANSTVGLELDDLAYKIQPAYNYWRYPTSARYGGENHAVDTEAEIGAVLAALGSATSDQEWDSIWNGLSPADQARIQPGIQANDDTLLRDTSNGAVYYYAAGVISLVTNQTVANQLGLDLSKATPVPHSLISTYSLGEPITEAALAAPDEPIGSGATIRTVKGHPEPDKGYFWIKGYDLVFASSDNKAQFRGTLHWFRKKWNPWKFYVQWQGGSRSQALTPGVCHASAFGAQWGGLSFSWSWPPAVSTTGTANSEGYTRCPSSPITNAADISWGGHRPYASDGRTKGHIKYVVVRSCTRSSASSPTVACVSRKGDRRGNWSDY